MSIFSLHTLELIKISILIRQSLLLKQQIQVNSTTDSIPPKGQYYREKRSENVSEHDTQLAYVVKTIIEIGKNMEKPRQIFLPPLPGVITDKTDWEGLS